MINLSMPERILLDRARRAYRASTDPAECDRLDAIIQALEKSLRLEDLTDEEAETITDWLLECDRLPPPE